LRASTLMGVVCAVLCCAVLCYAACSTATLAAVQDTIQSDASVAIGYVVSTTTSYTPSSYVCACSFQVLARQLCETYLRSDLDFSTLDCYASSQK
jgi:hypothetical protein